MADLLSDNLGERDVGKTLIYLIFHTTVQKGFYPRESGSAYMFNKT
jgi:hypothetical protein